jgi:hypothetical protein
MKLITIVLFMVAAAFAQPSESRNGPYQRPRPSGWLFRKYCSPYEDFVSAAPKASVSDRRMCWTPLVD